MGIVVSSSGQPLSAGWAAPGSDVYTRSLALKRSGAVTRSARPHTALLKRLDSGQIYQAIDTLKMVMAN